MEKNHQLEIARNFVLYTDKNIFLTGKAGTGKTTFLRNLKEECPKRMAIVAPTGVAAINAGGVTIHSLFQMPFGPYLAEAVSGNRDPLTKNRKFNKEKINLIQSLDLLVIDEISMVRADLLDGIDEVLRRYKNKLKPFGGVQLLMIGDLHQLSPVIKEEDWRILKPYYPNLYFFSSKALLQSAPACIELKHIYRQSDTYFIDILNKVRENKIDQQLLMQLNQRHITDFKPDEDEGYITLTTHNNSALDINNSKLKELDTKTSIFKAVVTGEFPEFSYPTESELELKVGAQVMFVKNDVSRDKLFYNGKIGKITRIESERIFVRCPKEFHDIEVTATQWDNLNYELNPETKEVSEKIIGTFTQVPLKLAWAITIHKSQGLTFDKAIIDAASSFAHGQVYVALSRCKTFEGMVLSSPIKLNSVKTDGTIATYTRQAEQNAPGEEQLIAAKASFQRNILSELFDFKALQSRLFYCRKQAQEHYNLLPQTSLEIIDSIKSQAEKEIYTVAETFKREIARLDSTIIPPEENDALQHRIKKASTYFFEKLHQTFFEQLKALSLETDNRAVNKILSEAKDNLRKEVIVKLATLNIAVSGLNTIAYLRAKADAEIDFQATEKTSEARTTTAPASISNGELYQLLKKWRDDLAKQRNTAVYLILPSKVLLELVSSLPSSLYELEKIKGVGKQKVKQYGQQILQIINDYCGENDIKRSSSRNSVDKEKSNPDTKRQSLELFKAGKQISEIAKERNLTAGTVEGHLISYIGTAELDFYELVPKKKAQQIIETIETQRLRSLNEIKSILGDDFSFGEIKAVLKHLGAIEAAETSSGELF
ncbi:helix-turn-helix domain-containing protein [Desertivirga brevis]|uniref:helix-turn-helix domain-containing protein n=1 Tax=Desertivirga brevis TaxID=2810310 RepID=UPI001A979663|nr:helix-turn-helix domain-containing protein [Pedobacter sp. SYSU D00873]